MMVLEMLGVEPQQLRDWGSLKVGMQQDPQLVQVYELLKQQSVAQALLGVEWERKQRP
jgi:hypothetical protein